MHTNYKPLDKQRSFSNFFHLNQKLRAEVGQIIEKRVTPFFQNYFYLAKERDSYMDLENFNEIGIVVYARKQFGKSNKE